MAVLRDKVGWPYELKGKATALIHDAGATGVTALAEALCVNCTMAQMNLQKVSSQSCNPVCHAARGALLKLYCTSRYDDTSGDGVISLVTFLKRHPRRPHRHACHPQAPRAADLASATCQCMATRCRRRHQCQQGHQARRLGAAQSGQTLGPEMQPGRVVWRPAPSSGHGSEEMKVVSPVRRGGGRDGLGASLSSSARGSGPLGAPPLSPSPAQHRASRSPPVLRSPLASYPNPMSRQHTSSIQDLMGRTFSAVADTAYTTVSDRIGRNYTPTAVGLTLRVMDEALKGGRMAVLQTPGAALGVKLRPVRKGKRKQRSAPLLSPPSSVLTTFPAPVATLSVSPSRASGLDIFQSVRSGEYDAEFDPSRSSMAFAWNPEPEAPPDVAVAVDVATALEVATPRTRTSMLSGAVLEYWSAVEAALPERAVMPHLAEWEDGVAARLSWDVDSWGAMRRMPCGATPREFLSDMVTEMRTDYVRAMRRTTVDYDLRSMDVRQHHGLDVEAVDSVRYIHPPVESRDTCGISHDSVNRAGAALVRRLHVTEPCLLKLWDLWWFPDRGYDRIRLTDCHSLAFRSELPLSPDDFVQAVESLIDKAVLQLRSQWHKDCAETIAEFVIALESPAKAEAEGEEASGHAATVQRVDPLEADFSRFYKRLKESGRARRARSSSLSVADAPLASAAVSEVPSYFRDETEWERKQRKAAAASVRAYDADAVESKDDAGDGGEDVLGDGDDGVLGLTVAERGGTPDDDPSGRRLNGVFSGAAVLMSRRLKDVVYGAIDDVASFLSLYASGDRGKHERDCVPVFKVSLAVSPTSPTMLSAALPGSIGPERVRTDEVQFVFSPSWETVELKVDEVLVTVSHGCSALPRVEQEIAAGPGTGEGGDVSAATALPVLPPDDGVLREARERVKAVIRSNRAAPDALLARFNKFHVLFNSDEISRIVELSESAKPLATNATEIDRLLRLADDVNATCGDIVFMSMTSVLTADFKASVCQQAYALVATLLRGITQRIASTCTSVNNEYARISGRLNSKPESSEELVELAKWFQDDLLRELAELREAFYGRDGIRDLVLFLYKYKGHLREAALLFRGALHWPKTIEDDKGRCQEVLDAEKNRLVERLEWRVGVFRTELDKNKAAMERVTQEASMTLHKVTEVSSRMTTLRRALNENLEEARAINEQQRLLDVEVVDWSTDLVMALETLGVFEVLWKHTADYLTLRKKWYETPLLGNTADTAEKEGDAVKVALIKATKDIPETSPEVLRVAGKVREELMHFLRKDLALMSLLANPGVKERHWKQMEEAVGFELPHSPSSTLQDMIDLKLHLQIEAIEETCVTAQKEYSLEKAMDRMEADWQPVELELKAHKDTGTHILTGATADEVQGLLDDHIVKAQTMTASRYAKPILQRIKDWLAALTEIQNVLDAWLKVQATWLYLEPIFSSEDIMRQMPEEGARFKVVDTTWRTIMKKAVAKPAALHALRMSGQLEKLQEANQLLDLIQKGLNEYLETKRMFFPRFFFLSNDELLEILAETKDPLRVQPHLKKCFEGIANLHFEEDLTIKAMFSAEGERVALSPDEAGAYINPKDARGNVEIWLLQVEAAMRRSVARVVDEAVKAYAGGKGRPVWATTYPGQSVLCVSQSYWTRDVERALRDEGNPGLHRLAKQYSEQLTDITELVRGELTKMARVTLGALVTLDVHARDVTRDMAASGVSEVHAFGWSAQLRYYWADDGMSARTGRPGSLQMRMINARIFYAGEYLGNTGRLVITPLTDRCYRTLMGAIHLNLGGAPEGPAGTGKTETVKDLAKAAGMMCVVFNCSDGLDYLAMGKFFKGLASCGAWSCFDEFNRIELEVLSVVAQQILTIQRAKAESKERFVFEGTDIKLDPTANVFITMNPGYAGRSELPDNLKALFRSVAMMVPDYALIAEIILYSYGYVNSRPMARKIVAVYKLCSEQLSSQDHYDYGMRAVMAVLWAAGNLRRAEAYKPEDVLVLQAIVDVNLPKFLSHDIPLFQGIVSDLFPGVVQQPPDRALLIDAMRDACHELGLQPEATTLQKTLQVYEMMIVRHGFMLVGMPWAGKTSSKDVLQLAMRRLHESLPEDKRWAVVHHVVINPKSVTMGNLYGMFDEVTHEWTDGVLPAKFRDCVYGKVFPPEDRKWIVFDGPVDTIWIESMNTVLDDNKKLCLTSGEIIQMTDVMNIVMETQDLAVASPATVSRCGMIYMEPSILGWRPFFNSWLDNLMEDNPKYVLRPARPSRHVAPPAPATPTPTPTPSTPIAGENSEAAVRVVDAAGEAAVEEARAQDHRPFTLDAAMRRQLVDLVDWLLEPCLVLLRKRMVEYAPTQDTTMVASLLYMFEVCLAQMISAGSAGAYRLGAATMKGRMEPTVQDVESFFVFALVWSVGASTNEDGRTVLSEFLRNATEDPDYLPSHELAPFFKMKGWEPPPGGRRLGLPFPVRDSVHSYVYSPGDGAWKTWTDVLPAVEIPAETAFAKIIVPTTDTTQFEYLVSLLVASGKRVLVCGPTGTGKSVCAARFLSSLDPELYISIALSFSAQTTSKQTQGIIDQRLDRRRKGVYGPRLGTRAVIFVDDLNMPQVEVYGAQPPVELLRQMISNGGWYDLTETSFKRMEDCVVVTAMGPPGGGRNNVSPRMLRQFNLLCFTEFDSSTLTRIFTSIMDWNCRQQMFPGDISAMTGAVVAATLATYRWAVATLRPTPAKSHYTFNLRDFSKVVQGVLLAKPATVGSPETLTRLWFHESTRVFADRLCDNTDTAAFVSFARGLVKSTMKQDFDTVFDHVRSGDEGVTDDDLRSLFWGDFLDPKASPRLYVEMQDTRRLTQVLEDYLEDYNAQSKKPLDLVLFLFFIEHVARLARVLKMPGGHALLVGVGGSGRQCSTRLAAFMADFNLVTIELTKGYGKLEWADDLKKLLTASGTGSADVVLLFTDTQIKWEGMVEDINNLLNSGEVPNLFASDERAEILDKVTGLAKAAGMGKDLTPPELWAYFIERSRQRLHVVFCLSPIGDAFRERVRKFPSLINCCTIDWFKVWPPDALTAVAHKSLSEMRDLDQSLTPRLVNICMHFHESVRLLSERFLTQLRRYNYVTPTSYLELLSQFKKSLGVKQREVSGAKRRYEVGLEKLEFATQQVNLMQKELQDLQPVLEQSQRETAELLVVIQARLPGVEETRAVVKREADVANAEAEKVAASKKECEDDLAVALPILEAALKALDTITRDDITLVKSMTNPPPGVRLTMAAVLVMLGEKPDRVPDPAGGVKKVEDYWAPAKRLLTDMGFIRRLKEYDRDNVDSRIMAVIRKQYTCDPNFIPEKVKQASSAAMGMCEWVRAMDSYDQVARVVAPKREALKIAEAELSVAMAELAKKQASLKKAEDELAELQGQYEGANRKKIELEHAVDMCKKKLQRAEQLIKGLGGERRRWDAAAVELGKQLVALTGDVLLASGLLAYLGPFTSDFRHECVTDWVSLCVGSGMPCSSGGAALPSDDGVEAASTPAAHAAGGSSFSLARTLGDPIQIRQWFIDGLPTDAFSVENGIIVQNARRWPLMIDPQGQANKWVKAMEKENQLQVIKLTDATFMRTLENAIQFGQPVLLENVGEELDPGLEPVLLKQIFKMGGVASIRLGDATIEYSDSFRFYITTKLRNPHYLPEVSTKVSLLNFMITPVGLEDQLLGIVVAEERPDLEEEKNRLILESAENKKQLAALEDKILKTLSESQGNILEDERAIDVLNSSKDLSNDIKDKQAKAELVMKEIDAARAGYQPVAFHTSVLFFCISDLAAIDPMYQYSMTWFVNLFLLSISNSKKSDDLPKRIANLNNYFTFSLFSNVCRSLFEKDKLLFSFLLTMKVLDGAGKVDHAEWYFLLTGGIAMDNPYPNPVTWLPDKQWGELCRLDALPAYKGIREEFSTETRVWRAVFDNDAPHKVRLPGQWGVEGVISRFQRILILRCIRPDKMILAIQDFVEAKMGRKFLEPPPFDLGACHADSSVASPLVFVLSPGSDPMARLLKFADDKRVKVLSISLGQGQGPIAAKMIKQARHDGSWVCLQNCHLAVSWLPELERITEDLEVSPSHDDFRLWLTSYPSPAFPVSILQNGVKMTNEPPQGMKANLRLSYLSHPVSDPTFFNSVVNAAPFRHMLFGLAFFHAVIQERRQYGALGWNIPYEFNDSDFRICVRQLAIFCDDPSFAAKEGQSPEEALPYQTLLYTAGEANYGGRVTDDKDRRCLMSILNKIYCSHIHRANMALSESGDWKTPPAEVVEYKDFMAFVDTLPAVSMPEVLGLHENANIAKDQSSTNVLFSSILLTQRAAGGSAASGKSEEESIAEVVNDVASKIPPPFDTEVAQAKYPVVWKESLNTVLVQELARYNRLLGVIAESLSNLKKALKGLVVMNKQLEDVGSELFFGVVPTLWRGRSYPSLKPLGAYVADLCARLRFLQRWLDEGPPPTFWMPGFFFTQSFLTGALQNYARRYTVPIDDVAFDFEILGTDHAKFTRAPGDGVYVYGLYIDGCRWDVDTQVLAESEPKVLFADAPVMWFVPKATADLSTYPWYVCPVYKTSERRGTLSTTGHSTNFVLMIRMPSDKPEDHWIQRGVAMLLQLDN